MTGSELAQHLASGPAAPLYLIESDDPPLRQELAAQLLALVEPDLQAFNVEIFHATDASSVSSRDQMIAAILAAARTLPMLGARRLVMVHAAERLLAPRRSREDEPEAVAAPAAGRGRKTRAVALTPDEELERYLLRPEASTAVVFVADPLDGSRRLVKLLRENAVRVEAGGLNTPADAARWVRERLKRDKLVIEASAMPLLLQGTGLSLSALRAQVEKLALYAAGQGTVTAAHVRDLVAPSAEPTEGFALGRAIWNGDAAGALREVAAQFEAGAQAPMVLGQIRAAAGKLRPDSRIRSGVDAVLRTDLAIKSSVSEGRFLVERLVIELCAGGVAARQDWPRR